MKESNSTTIIIILISCITTLIFYILFNQFFEYKYLTLILTSIFTCIFVFLTFIDLVLFIIKTKRDKKRDYKKRIELQIFTLQRQVEILQEISSYDHTKILEYENRFKNSF